MPYNKWLHVCSHAIMDSALNALSPSTLSKIGLFIRYASRHKNDILLAQPSHTLSTSAPIILPESVTQLLCRICDLADADVSILWAYLCDKVWLHDQHEEDIA